VLDCPYLILERGKTALAVSTALAPPQSALPDVRSTESTSVIAGVSRIPDSTDLFLRIRVLLI
jgi:hypothetical protein